jgi:hypothetical protein
MSWVERRGAALSRRRVFLTTKMSNARAEGRNRLVKHVNGLMTGGSEAEQATAVKYGCAALDQPGLEGGSSPEASLTGSQLTRQCRLAAVFRLEAALEVAAAGVTTRVVSTASRHAVCDREVPGTPPQQQPAHHAPRAPRPSCPGRTGCRDDPPRGHAVGDQELPGTLRLSVGQLTAETRLQTGKPGTFTKLLK